MHSVCTELWHGLGKWVRIGNTCDGRAEGKLILRKVRELKRQNEAWEPGARWFLTLTPVYVFLAIPS